MTNLMAIRAKKEDIGLTAVSDDANFQSPVPRAVGTIHFGVSQVVELERSGVSEAAIAATCAVDGHRLDAKFQRSPRVVLASQTDGAVVGAAGVALQCPTARPDSRREPTTGSTQSGSEETLSPRTVGRDTIMRHLVVPSLGAVPGAFAAPPGLLLPILAVGRR